MKYLFPLSALLAATALGQPSATMRPALLSSVDVEVSSSSKENLGRDGTDFGPVAVLSTSVSLSGRHQVNPSTVLLYGLAYQQHRLDATTSLLPDQLAELSLNLGLQRRFSSTWSAALFARPGFYGDFEDFSGRSLNLPVLALVNYTHSPTLTWNFGLNLNAFSDNPVLPIAGVRWQFAQDWTFSVGFPQSGFSWRRDRQLTLRAGVGFNGGSYRIVESRGVPAPSIARLANTYLDFREIRAGLGADYRLLPRLVLSLDLGAVTDRKFDYFDRGFRLDGDAGFYASLALKATF